MKNIKLFNENKIGIIFSKSLSFKESEKKKKKIVRFVRTFDLCGA